ncbi:polysaccharide pyruvyl transferase family protein [Achromobacter sp. NPDC008082]|uniref:polysaccharide pyruvyl transferase family protein n=1 Tax=Achromobacter sp. NPDC008082 TaxID=3363888 RepID=UPI0036EFEF0A
MISKIETLRQQLRTKKIDADKHWKILFLGRSVNGSTDIVSCLIRALQNLGHQVLNIDIGKHKDMTENPTRAQGGNGPIYVKLSKIETAVTEFNPHIIIFGAGGLCFTEEDAKVVQSMGILSLGITLSDPDVFPTVSTYANSFDFHTTNAMRAMDMYKEIGVKNTLYFPFAIDRGYVTQEVAHVPGMDADVICLGHATSRPERNDVMLALAQRFNVKTYGRGWLLPGSEVVEGTRQLQASRQGKCHVNFAATRAGFINIKCGVFETIASGRLLCTARFDEMSNFFDYDTQILGWDSEAELESELSRVLSNPAVYQAAVESAFERLVNEHLYEHRWLQLFKDIEASLVSDNCPIAEPARTIFRQRLSEDLGRTKRVILSGFYGANNAGDEMILRSISKRIAAADKSTQVVIAAENPLFVELTHGLPAFRRSLHHVADSYSRNASAIVVGGGGLWHDYTFSRAGGIRSLFTGAKISIAGFSILPMIGMVRQVPFFGVGLGVGPLHDPEAKQLLKWVANHATSIQVRDQESLDALQELELKTQCSLEPDVVYAVDLGDVTPDSALRERAAGRAIVGVNVRHWQKETGQPNLVALAAALDAIAARGNVYFVGIPMQEGGGHDRDALEFVFARMQDRSSSEIYAEIIGVHNIANVLNSFDYLIAMRLHAALIAHRLHKRVLGLSYDPKVRKHFAEVSRSDFVLDISARDTQIVEKFDALVAEFGALSSQTVADLARLEFDASNALDRVAADIARVPVVDKAFELPLAEAIHEATPRATANAQAFTTDKVWQRKTSRPALRSFERRSADASNTGEDWLSGRLQMRSFDLALASPASDDEFASDYVNHFGDLATNTAMRNGSAGGEYVSNAFVSNASEGALDSDARQFRADLGGSGRMAGNPFEQSQEVDDRRYVLRLDEGVTSHVKAHVSVEGAVVTSAAAISLRLPISAPRRKDSTQAIIEVPLIAGRGHELSFQLNKHYERPRNKGYIYCLLKVDGTPVWMEDIALRRGDINLSILIGKKQAEVGVSRLTFELVAARNCKNWNWEKAAKVKISNACIRQTDYEGVARAVASSPYSLINQNAKREYKWLGKAWAAYLPRWF